MKEIIDLLNSIDHRLFFFFNVTGANRFFDFLMPLITEKKNLQIPVIIFWFLLIWKGGKNGRIAAFILIPVIIASDQISSSVIKPLVGRLRPCKTLENFRLLVHCGGALSFTSSHAANFAAGATVLVYFLRKLSALWISIALLIGFSRIYVGVHYPFDVLGGFLLGSSLALTIIYLSRFLYRKYFALKSE